VTDDIVVILLSFYRLFFTFSLWNCVAGCHAGHQYCCLLLQLFTAVGIVSDGGCVG